MFLLRVYKQWRGIYFVGEHFSAVARGRKLYVIVLVCLGSAFLVCVVVSWCVVDNFYFWYCVESVIFAVKVLMPLLRSLTWMRVYLSKALNAHRPMIMIVSGYTLAR